MMSMGAGGGAVRQAAPPSADRQDSGVQPSAGRQAPAPAARCCDRADSTLHSAFRNQTEREILRSQKAKSNKEKNGFDCAQPTWHLHHAQGCVIDNNIAENAKLVVGDGAHSWMVHRLVRNSWLGFVLGSSQQAELPFPDSLLRSKMGGGMRLLLASASCQDKEQRGKRERGGGDEEAPRDERPAWRVIPPRMH